jgi:hypothetical protein
LANGTVTEFAKQLGSRPTVDRAVALIWFHGREKEVGTTPRQVARELHDAGFAQQNVTRLRRSLDRDPRVRKAKGGGYRIDAASLNSLTETFGPFLGPQPPPATDSVIPPELTQRTRGYIEKVVYQINASYDTTLFDCCTVMCRRLLETLIIEVYEHEGRSAEIKNADGHYWMFSALLLHLEADPTLHVGRQALKGLKALKKLGDQSAHNRRFNATRSDIDRVIEDVRLAVEELLHIGGLKT